MGGAKCSMAISQSEFSFESKKMHTMGSILLIPPQHKMIICYTKKSLKL